MSLLCYTVADMSNAIYLQIQVIILSKATAQLQECTMFIIYSVYIHSLLNLLIIEWVEVSSTYPTVYGPIFICFILLSKPRRLSYNVCHICWSKGGRWNLGSRAGIIVVQRCCFAVLRCRDFGSLANRHSLHVVEVDV